MALMSSCSKIKNKSSFGTRETDDHSAIDRIIVIVSTSSLTALGEWLCRSMLHRYSLLHPFNIKTNTHARMHECTNTRMHRCKHIPIE